MTRMTDPDRASRLWLVLAVATHYVLAVGGEADAADTEVETLPVLPPASQTTRAAERSTGQSVQTRRPIAATRSSAREPKKRASGTRQRLVSVFPTRIGGVGQHSDRRACVAKTSMETRAVVGDSSQCKNML